MTLTQAKTLRLIRKPLPRPGQIILDKKRRAKRRRPKHVEPYFTPAWANTL